MVVTQKDYDREVRSGISPDEALKPGTYKGRRGGFLERHKEELASGRTETKVGIYIKIDQDVLKFFKSRAARPNSAPYQTQINNALRAFMQESREEPQFAEFLNNEDFISAVAKKVRKKSQQKSA